MRLIGIAGGTGSGKTTFASELKTAFGNDALLLSMDNYYFSQEDVPLSERSSINYDSPRSIDFELLESSLRAIALGEPVVLPVYDFATHTRIGYTKLDKPVSTVILEGILALFDDGIREMMDLKLFIDLDADVRALRRVARDVKERERTLDGSIEQYLCSVKRMHEMYVEPTKRYADVIIRGDLDGRATASVVTMIASFDSQ